MKLYFKLLCSIVIIAVTVVPVSYENCNAAGGRFYFSEYRYEKLANDAEIPVEKPENGFISISVKARYSGAGTGSAYLIAAFMDKEYGKILNISYDFVSLSDGEEKKLKAGLEITDITAGEYKYYLWDSLTGHVPLDNSTPAPPKTPSVSGTGTDYVSLAWEESEDDFDDIAYYNVYNQGMLVGTTSDTFYKNTKLDSGEKQSYYIEAVDGEGLVSAGVETEGKTNSIPTCILAPGKGSSEVQNDSNLSFWNMKETWSYAYTEATEAGGRPCRITTIKETKIGRMHFLINKNYITEADRQIVLEITYFDDGTDEIYVQYNTADDGWGGLAAITTKTNTMRWKVASVAINNFKISDANYGEGFANFRLYTLQPGLKIYKVSVCKAQDYVRDSASVKITDAMTIRDLDFYIGQSAGGMITQAEIEGTKCLYAQTGKYFEFNVDNRYMPGTVRDAVIEVEYYDNTGDSLVLEYNSITNAYSKAVQPVGNTGMWRKASFKLADAKFEGRITGSALRNVDFRLSAENGSPLYVKTVRIY